MPLRTLKYASLATLSWALGCSSEVDPVQSTEHTTAALDVGQTYLSMRTPDKFLHGSQAAKDETRAYYDSWHAPQTLTAFEQEWGFRAPQADIAGAIYFNAGDLGFGREMHCVATQGGKRACYVKNYGTDANGQVVFNGDPTQALNDAARRQHSFATVAMTYDPSAGGDAVQFVVYSADGQQKLDAQLDSVGYNTAIPFNCTNCHGGSYDTTSGVPPIPWTLDL